MHPFFRTGKAPPDATPFMMLHAGRHASGAPARVGTRMQAESPEPIDICPEKRASGVKSEYVDIPIEPLLPHLLPMDVVSFTCHEPHHQDVALEWEGLGRSGVHIKGGAPPGGHGWRSLILPCSGRQIEACDKTRLNKPRRIRGGDPGFQILGKGSGSGDTRTAKGNQRAD